MRGHADHIIQAVRECVSGNSLAFESIVRTFQHGIYRLCLDFFKNPEDAEDATVEVFIKALKAIKTYDEKFKFSTWIFKIAINHSLEVLRRKKREREYLEGECREADRLVDYSSPVSEADHQARVKLLKKGLKLLPLKYRTALYLKYQQDFSYRQIGEIMGIPSNTVGSLLLRGRRELRVKFQQLEGSL